MDAHYCPDCGYDLRGSTGDRCPECGVAVDRLAIRSRLKLRGAATSWFVTWTLQLAVLYVIVCMCWPFQFVARVGAGLCIAVLFLLAGRAATQEARQTYFIRIVTTGRLPGDTQLILTVVTYFAGFMLFVLFVMVTAMIFIVPSFVR